MKDSKRILIFGNTGLNNAPIFILKSRPGIYRDFFYDFWKKIKNFRKDKIGTINYIYTNPLIEIMHGFPFLWILIWDSFNKPINPLSIHFWELIFITTSIFFLTSFNKTRFLGEPQRYMEFIIPLIVVQYVSTVDNSVFWWSSGIVLFFICMQQLLFYILKNKNGNVFYYTYRYILSHIRKEDIVMSNDTNLSKFLMPHCSLGTIDLTRYYKNKNDFLNLTKKQLSYQKFRRLGEF